MFKRKLSPGDLFLLLVNLVPLWGVWFDGWSAMEAFMVYCFETIIVGVYTLLRLFIATITRKKDVWNNQGESTTNMSGYFFMLFFLVHYGMFVAIQMSIFLSVSGAEKFYNLSGTWELITKFPHYLSRHSQLLLLGFIISYGIFLLKDFVLNGAYKTLSMNAIMFEPYGRIFVQQFTVIVGSMFLGLGAGKVFISIFVLIKIVFDVFVNFNRMVKIIAKKDELAQSRQQ